MHSAVHCLNRSEMQKIQLSLNRYVEETSKWCSIPWGLDDVKALDVVAGTTIPRCLVNQQDGQIRSPENARRAKVTTSLAGWSGMA